jgi:hypothetical protein
VDQNIDESVTGVDGTRDRAVRNGALRLERSRPMEDFRRRFRRGIERCMRIGTEQIAVKAVTDLIDRGACR